MDIKKHFTVKNIVFLILVLIILKGLSYIVAIALLFFASYVIACSLNPIVDKLSKKMPRYTATILVITCSLSGFFAFFIPIIFVAVKQIQGLIVILPEKLELIQDFVYNHKFYGYKIPEIINIDTVLKSSSPVATGILNQSINLTVNFAEGVLFFLAICMIVFYMLADKDLLKERFIKLFPDEIKERADIISKNISHKVGGYVIAQILTMIAVGILTTIGLLIVKVDYALLLGLITGVLDIIPVLGPSIALGLCLLIAYQSGWVTVALVIVAFLTAQWASNNLVRPVVFGKFLDLHPLVIIFALLVSAQFLGFLGVILAPAIAALICVLFDEIYIKAINKVE